MTRTVARSGIRRFVWRVRWREFSCASQLARQMIQSVFSEDASRCLEAASWFRKLLSRDKNPPIERVIQCGFVPRFVQFLRNGNGALKVRGHPTRCCANTLPQCACVSQRFPIALAYTTLDQATSVLTIISAGTSEHTDAVVSAGAVPELINLISSPDVDVREEAVWALGARPAHVLLWLFDCLSR